MKKAVCLIMVLCLMFCLSCGNNGGETKKEAGAIDRYAAEGVIPEIDVALGTGVASFKEKYPNDYEDADESKVLLQEVEGNTAVCLVTLNASFYYEKAKVDNGISVIAVMAGNAFGLELGNTTTKSDIVALLSAEYTESDAVAEELYFFPGYVESCDKITATFDSYRLDFFLIDSFLMAVTLTDTENWTD